MLYILLTMIAISCISILFFVLSIRTVQIKSRLTYHIRTALKANELSGGDYQDIFTMLTELSSSLTKRNINNIWDVLNNINFIRVLTFRPVTYDPTRLHLNYAFANLSEVSRDRFRTDKDAVEKLTNIFSDISDSIIADDHAFFIENVAAYYRLLRQTAEENSADSVVQRANDNNLINVIGKIQKSLAEADTFKAYNYILEFKESYNYEHMSDFEILASNYLSSKLECFIQGTKYFIAPSDILKQLSEIKSHCVTLIKALRTNNPTMLLKAAA